MQREALRVWLEEGLSLEQIGRRVGKHPSTVSYWIEKHGLTAANRSRHAARGSISRETLEALVVRDMTIREIAAETDRSAATVRYWMNRYGLRTSEAARSRAGRYARKRFADCPTHGETHFIVHRDGTTSCARCRASSVTEWRRRAKRILVAEAGGACVLCGYDRCIAALQFHHRDPAQKRFALGGRGLSRAIHDLREEAQKCVLLCSNCHAEVEAGVANLLNHP
jgi:transposase